MQGYEQAEFMRITSAIAEAILLSENNGISRTSLIEVIEKCMPLLHGRGNQVLTALESDRILSKSPDGSEFGFRHARFMEYLVAWSAITKADDSSLSFLDRYVAAMISYPYLSPFRVRELILFLAKRLNEVTQRRIEEFFISSTNFAAANARRMRSEIRHGLTTSEDDIDLIKRTGVAGSPSVLWDNFFVLAAAANRQQSKVIAEAFKLAWDSNANSAERWKLIEKVNDRKMLSVDSIWSLISAHGNSREVETLLGRTLESGSYQLACEMAEIISKRFEPGPEWAVVVKLCAIAQSRGEYVLGNFV
ncbi:hypothetical protein [Teredinibacter turnerae]|uniref:hypothetical protein n=1 Tax=Teredinibacter turnerae TaxID=2426 RepID=UPI0030D53143